MYDSKTRRDVGLSEYDSNLDFKIYNRKKDASTMTLNGFQYLWSGARANMGIHCGKYWFECTIIEYNTVLCLPDHPLTNLNACRIGWSTSNASLQLGQDSFSFGYESSGYRFHQGEGEPFGEPFVLNDVIGCYYDADNLKICYTKNGQFLGTAFSVPSEFRDLGLFPHVLLLNVAVHLNFGQEPKVCPNLKFEFIMDADIKNCTAGMTPPVTKDCEVVMLVGLPCSGKTTWAKKILKSDFMKNYTLIGYESIMNQMHLDRKEQRTKIPKRLFEAMESIYWTMLRIAGTKERNYMIDDYNFSPEGRKMVLKNFPGLRKKAVVFLPKLSEVQKRFEKCLEKRITPERFNQMQSSFSIPRKIGITFSDIQYIDTRTPEDIVNEYRSSATATTIPSALSSTTTSTHNTYLSQTKTLSKSTDLIQIHTAGTGVLLQHAKSLNQPLSQSVHAATATSLSHSLSQSNSLSQSAPLSSTANQNHRVNYYSSVAPYLRKTEIPLRTIPSYAESQYFSQVAQAQSHSMRLAHYPTYAGNQGMKLSRSDYYISSKSSQYDYKAMPLNVHHYRAVDVNPYANYYL